MLIKQKCQGCGFIRRVKKESFDSCVRCDHTTMEIVGEQEVLHTLVIYADNTKDLLKTEEVLPLKELQKLVSGYIELTYTLDDKEMYVNEEGLLQDLPPNLAASLLTGNYIVGTAVVCLVYEMP